MFDRQATIAAVHRLSSLTFGMLAVLVKGGWFDRPAPTWTWTQLVAAGIAPERATRLLHELPTIKPETSAARLRELGISIITLGSPDYPFALTQISSPPPVLYLRGDRGALHRPALAVVGTRRPTTYGLTATQTLLDPVIRAGITIVSGLALGIDGQAHHLAVDLGAPTVAVLGSGIDVIYPPEHRGLAGDIMAHRGAIISEFPLGAEPARHHFPQRNRIIAGLSRATFLVEAGEKSGALITAKFAVEQNREVLCLPGLITSPQSVGPLNWLKLGATPVTRSEDILRVFSIESVTAPTPTTTYRPHSEIERLVLSFLSAGPLHVDELAEKSRLDSSVVSATLSLLEINRAVHHLGGLVYSLT